ncbi:hypothetical protein OQA88_9770 [Cercophora sp. LCS_1]
MRLPSRSTSKRKHINDEDNPAPKKQRVVPAPTSETSHYFVPYGYLLELLQPKYEVKTMSVMPSTSIQKHVDKALQHMGRFNPWDQAVLPGVVFFSAKVSASNKLITISELVRQRIGESEQKWYQYNVLADTEDQEPADISMVEDTLVASSSGAGVQDDDANEYFETMRPSVYEQAINPIKTKHRSYLSVFFSRVPIQELRSLQEIAVQTNETKIDVSRQRRIGFVV